MVIQITAEPSIVRGDANLSRHGTLPGDPAKHISGKVLLIEHRCIIYIWLALNTVVHKILNSRSIVKWNGYNRKGKKR